MQKKHTRSDTKPVKFFVVVKGNRGTNDRVANVNLEYACTTRPDVLTADQTCFEMKLDIPVSAFEYPTCSVSIQASDLIPHELIAEVGSWIVEDISERDSSDRSVDQNQCGVNV